MSTRRAYWARSAFSYGLSALCFLSLPARAHEFVGARQCGTCHTFAYARWQAGPHAHARRSLNEKQNANPACLSCHGGPLELDAQLGVTCEQCHGPGKAYQPEFVMRDPELARLLGLQDPSAARCTTCHQGSAPSLLPFDFGKMWARIDHSFAAERAAQSAGVQPPSVLAPVTEQLPDLDLRTATPRTSVPTRRGHHSAKARPRPSFNKR